MKKTLMFLAVMTMGWVLATPVLAGHRDHYRGHSVRVVRGGYHRVYYAPAPRPRNRLSLFFGFGVPYFAPASLYVYAPPPVVLGPCLL